ncbi:MAG: HNH endonuclease [Verrucomicrobiae bacterium]|nr:HNH endonuclease [Verrucomicrobiae bacterium]
MEVWIDRFAGHKQMTFWAGFFCEDEKVIRDLVRKVQRNWPVVLELTGDDVEGKRTTKMKTPLPASKLGAQVAEYYTSRSFFGFFQRPKGSNGFDSKFCRQAADFFLDVIDRFRDENDSSRDEEVYPRVERTVVKSHLTRERSRFLASQCKERDGYQCVVCEMRFEEVYGRLGRDFAEAHHRQALASLDPAVPTKLKDLATVCANCHRMLHRMEGVPGDIAKLRAIVKRRRNGLR